MYVYIHQPHHHYFNFLIFFIFNNCPTVLKFGISVRLRKDEFNWSKVNEGIFNVTKNVHFK